MFDSSSDVHKGVHSDGKRDSFSSETRRSSSSSSSPRTPQGYVEYDEPHVTYLILQVLGANGLKPRPEQAVYATVKFGSNEARTRILVGANTNLNWREKFIFPVMPSEAKAAAPDKVVIAVFQVQRGFVDECLGKVRVSIVDVEKMKASPNVVQSFLLDVKQTKDTIAAEVLQFTSRKEYTFTDFSKAAGLKLAAKFKPLPVRRKVARTDDDAMFQTEKESEKQKMEEAESERDTSEDVFKEVQRDGRIKTDIEIQFRAVLLEEVEEAQELLGALRVEVLRASELHGGPSNPYIVLHYGTKWIRLNTQMHTSDPVWNQTLMFEVREISNLLCAAVFFDKQADNTFIKRDDVFLGKVRIRPSTLDVGKRYLCKFPLLRPASKRGFYTNGTLELAVTLETPLSTFQLCQRIISAPLPGAYYNMPETVEMYQSAQRTRLENVMNILASQNPPIRKEVSAQTLDEAEPPFDLQRAKVNIARFVAMKGWFDAKLETWDRICEWEKPLISILCQVVWVFFIYYSQFIVPAMFLMLVGISLEYYLKRQADQLEVPQSPDRELSSKSCNDPFEESSKSKDKEKGKDGKEEHERKKSDEREETWEDYVLNPLTRWESQLDEALAIVSSVQNAVGNIASFAERVANLVSWVDPRASTLFILTCSALALSFMVLPMRLILTAAGLFAMRPPVLRDPKPPPPVNMFLRLPTRLDQVYDWVALSTLKKGPQKGSKDSKATKAEEERTKSRENLQRTP